MTTRQRIQLIILCEDLQQEVFARHFFRCRGFHRSEITIMRNPNGKGSGEQFVRQNYAKQVKNYRRKSTYQSIVLVVMIDADKYTVKERLNQLDQSLEADGQPKRQPHEKIAIFVPKRNIETWIHYLMGKKVDQERAYPKLARQSQCKPVVDQLSRKICPIGLPEDAPPSLHTACAELQRIL